MINIAVEYIDKAIKVTAGQEFKVGAIIYDEDGELVTSSCYFKLFDKAIDRYDSGEELAKIYGTFDGEQWIFTIPADLTEGKVGRFWYTIGTNDYDIMFMQPLYLVG